MKEVLSGIHRLNLGVANAYLIDHGNLTMVDAGPPGSDKKILNYLTRIGKKPEDLDQILITHFHQDHIGGLARMIELTGAKTFMHAADADELEGGRCFRPEVQISPGLKNQLVYNLFIRGVARTISPLHVSDRVKDGDYLFIGKGIRAIATPGHTAGHISYLYPEHGGILFGGDAAESTFGLNLMIFYEDLANGRDSLKKLANESFQVACFGHGAPILKAAQKAFKKKFG